ncbi:MAG TPA: beta-galactosidase [Fimbriimonadaceae bacterium]|nr:beta-galactosidase [Fimbriimonadaceae bacterium]
MLLGLCLTLPATSTAQNSQYLISLDRMLRGGLVSGYHADVASAGFNAVSMTFRTSASYPTVNFKTPGASQGRGQDWRGYTAFVFNLENRSPAALRFRLRVDSSLNVTGLLNCLTSWEYIGPRQRAVYAFPVDADPTSYGMRGIPGVAGATWLQYNRNEVANLNKANIVRFLFFMENLSVPVTLVVSEPRLISAPIDLNGVADRFGQYSGSTWPGKVGGDLDLLDQRVDEDADLLLNPGPLGRSLYGGLLLSSGNTATGRFRTKKIGDKWWFIDPLGKNFLAFGMDAVNLGTSTITQDRRHMFRWLPTSSDPLYDLYETYNGKQAFRMAEANRRRKFGSEYVDLSLARGRQRLRSWGFNVIGNWSDKRLWSAPTMPYVIGLTVGPTATGVVAPSFTVDPSRKAIYDVFDSKFAQMLSQQAALVPATSLGDPWVFGWYVGNEPTFLGDGAAEEGGRYELAYKVLERSASSWECKRVFVADLRARYGTIQALNTAWGTSLASWTALEAGVALSRPSNAARKVDFQTYIRKFADTYFQKCRDAVRAKDPTAMYLGTRLFRFSPETIAANAAFADVISMSWYRDTVDPNWAATYGSLNKPFLISEFHFGATDRGMFHGGLNKRSSQQDRANAFRTYIDSVVNHPLVAGVFYFAYQDSPLTGRKEDGENYGTGFVSNVDYPYPEMVAKARQTLYDAPNRR